jgi:hydrogenase nickel incorporation protein HypA/HybF
MHELALMESLVDELTERFENQSICLVRLDVGELSGVDPEALEFCFGVCTRDTALAGASLDIVRTTARARCHDCGRDEPIRSLASPCACGSFDREVYAGDALLLKEVEVL